MNAGGDTSAGVLFVEPALAARARAHGPQFAPPLPTSKPLTQNRHGTSSRRGATIGASSRPQTSVSSILVPPFSAVTRKLIGCAVFSAHSDLVVEFTLDPIEADGDLAVLRRARAQFGQARRAGDDFAVDDRDRDRQLGSRLDVERMHRLRRRAAPRRRGSARDGVARRGVGGDDSERQGERRNDDDPHGASQRRVGRPLYSRRRRRQARDEDRRYPFLALALSASLAISRMVFSTPSRRSASSSNSPETTMRMSGRTRAFGALRRHPAHQRRRVGERIVAEGERQALGPGFELLDMGAPAQKP